MYDTFGKVVFQCHSIVATRFGIHRFCRELDKGRIWTRDGILARCATIDPPQHLQYMKGDWELQCFQQCFHGYNWCGILIFSTKLKIFRRKIHTSLVFLDDTKIPTHRCTFICTNVSIHVSCGLFLCSPSIFLTAFLPKNLYTLEGVWPSACVVQWWGKVCVHQVLGDLSALQESELIWTTCGE
jgi:hypothetical protein